MALPFELESISEEEKAERKRLFPIPTSSMVDMVVSKPGDVYLPKAYLEMASAIKSLKLRPDDILINTFPKAGTTWTQEMVWQVVNDFNPEKGKDHLYLRSPFLEMSCLGKFIETPTAHKSTSNARGEAMFKDSVGFVNEMDSPRVIKTHLALEFLPENVLEKCKTVWVARNVKDLAVSFFHHEQLLPNHGYRGTFEEYAELFMEGKVTYGST